MYSILLLIWSLNGRTSTSTGGPPPPQSDLRPHCRTSISRVGFFLLYFSYVFPMFILLLILGLQRRTSTSTVGPPPADLHLHRRTSTHTVGPPPPQSDIIYNVFSLHLYFYSTSDIEPPTSDLHLRRRTSTVGPPPPPSDLHPQRRTSTFTGGQYL